jgi:hypothetical protein
MSPLRHVVLGSITIAMATAAIASAASASATTPAVAVGPPIQGTVRWTTTDTTAPPTPTGEQAAPLTSSTSATTTGTLAIKLQRDPRYPGSFRVQDVGSTYSGSYSLKGETQQSDGESLTCTTEVSAQVSNQGALTPTPSTPLPPTLFARVVPAKKPAQLGPTTKAIVLRPFIEYSGVQTTTKAGSGESGCTGSTTTKPIQGTLAPGDDPDWVCYPAGTDAALVPPVRGAIIGVWNNTKKAFAFNCSLKVTPVVGRTVTVKIRGSLTYG